MKHYNVVMQVELMLNEDEFALMHAGRISETSVLREAVKTGQWVSARSAQVVATHDDETPVLCPKCGENCGYWNLPLGCGK